MPQCRRCGFVYPLQPGFSARPLSSASQREGTRAQPIAPAVSRQTNNLLLAGLLFFLLVGGAGFGLYRILNRPTGAGNPLAAGAPPIPSPPAASGDLTGSSGFFNERPGQSEKPVIHVAGDFSDTMRLRLRDAYGHEYNAVSRHGETVDLQVPAGEYAVYVEGDNPLVHPNAGDATFRPFKEYNARFAVGHEGSPFHLGD